MTSDYFPPEVHMGNRGTTPSWDDEQIGTYGLMFHLRSVARRLRPRSPTLQERRQELATLLQVLLEKQQSGNNSAG